MTVIAPPWATIPPSSTFGFGFGANSPNGGTGVTDVRFNGVPCSTIS